MALAVLFMLALFALIAWAPKELMQVGLMLAWGVGGLFVGRHGRRLFLLTLEDRAEPLRQ